MKELVFKSSSGCGCEEYLIPLFNNPNDVIIRITKTTICEVDVHISKGDIPEVMEQLILDNKGLLEFVEEESCISVLAVNNRALITYHRLRNL
jgi:threonine dehydrogenase-like Zn-dependent dehydrogenase